ncbi:extracellular solute-binding protein [Bacillus sp. 3255]|uniref:ABC transporter substrate-binding protein n=1 Tax=Bacillus sp. 3255 TaxID=2817904 RepID=UPI002856C30D|nr:extracellular solute-binding protein [Bacillus sp. 3255]MDR6881282.1 ABC-type glycerol-3-phosphate transport system substrate-binding protein [Bacillus sp. 3255]
MKKFVSVALATTMSLSILAACGSEGGSGAASETKKPAATAAAQASANPSDNVKGKVTFLTNRTDMIDKEYKDYAKRFKEKYPNADIEFEAIRDYDKNVKVRISTGDYPDIVLIPTIPNADLPKYFAPLDDMGLNDKIYFKDFKATGGKLYGIAQGTNTSGIVYNKKAFAEAGITAVPKTLDEFYAASEKLKAKGMVPLASNFKDKWPLSSWVWDLPTLIAGNAALGNDRVKSDTPYTLDGPYGKSMGILKTMQQKGYLEPDINSTNWEQSKKDVASGKFAMYYLGNWVINQVIENGAKSEDIGFFPMPFDNSGKMMAPLSPDWFYGVNKNSKNLETAKAFLKWLIVDSGYDNFAGFIPVLKDKQPELKQLVEFKSYNPTFLEGVADSDQAVATQNKAQIEPQAIVQDFVLGDSKAIFDKYNKQWADAKKALGY